MMASNGSNASDSGSEQNFQPPSGRVSRLRQNWSEIGDGALAQRLQSEEINQHLHGNRTRNHQIREDLPRARHEQVKELENACKKAEERRKILREIENRDAQVARTLLQDCPGTPPLPVMANGDVPDQNDEGAGARKIVYNDDQYLVKLARPALVKDEPLYANNKPEHYAVSTKYPGGAISKVPAASPRRRSFLPMSDSDQEDNVVGLAGLSQRDVVLSQRAEQQLEQQKRDEEIARRLQEQIVLEEDEDAKLAREAQDLEYAKVLHAKEKEKLRRAKERKRQKKLQMQQQQELEASNNPHHHRRSESQASNSGGHLSEARAKDDDEESVISAPHLKLPARRPYMNTGTLKLCFSGFSIQSQYKV